MEGKYLKKLSKYNRRSLIKFSTILIIAMVFISSIIFLKIDFNVFASPGGDGNGVWINETSLDYSFLWESIDNLSKVVHSDIWEDTNWIRKGRAFGTPGDNWTAGYLRQELIDMGFDGEDIYKEKLKTLGISDGWYPPWKCNYKIETIDFELEIYNNVEVYPYPNLVPKNETFVLPSALKNTIGTPKSLTYNREFTNAILLSKSTKSILEKEGITTDQYSNVTGYNETGYYNICGNATYINLTNNLPEDQEGRVFLFPEEEGIDAHLNNVTNASAVILLHNYSQSESEEQHWETSSDYSFQIARVNKNDNNLIQVVDMLNNGTSIMVDNYWDNETLTFVYNFSYVESWWPSTDFFVVSQNNNTRSLLGSTTRAYFYNLVFNPKCLGVISYDKEEYYTTDVKASAHIMEAPQREWRGNYVPYTYCKTIASYTSKSPLLQIFSVNYSVGKWLDENASTTTVSGNFEQAENYVDAYNVYVNITAEDNPQNKITLLSGRFDSWWGECPGDSGVGTCMILSVAKYFKDHDIKPINDLSFLFTTGEEYMYRGAWYHSISHPDDEIIRFIGTDQLGFDAPNYGQQTILSDNETDSDGGIIDAIVDIYNLKEDSGYDYRRNDADEMGRKSLIFGFLAASGTDEIAFRSRNILFPDLENECKTICIHKGKINESIKDGWDYHHRAGVNYTEGDSMKYIDSKDVNATFNYTWGVIKYFCVNPDSWFETNETTVYDSEDEYDFVDSIRTNFTVKSILPHDYMKVEALIYNGTDIYASNYMNLSVNSSGYNGSIVVSLPENASQGIYNYTIRLYNSTGWINDIMNYEGIHFNESNTTYGVFLSPLNWSGNAPNITNVSASPNYVGFGFNITLSADVTKSPEGSEVETVEVIVFDPDFTMTSNTMNNTYNNTYEYVFNNTWEWGTYRYMILAEDECGNKSGTNLSFFYVNPEATLSVCTIKNSYGDCEIVNLTDPPSQNSNNPQEIGYKLLDDGKVLHIWNSFDNYYFNTSNGIQLTNHKDEYWSHNVLMLGYYNNDIWNLLYRTDELSNFNKNIISDNETYINITLWKDLTYGGYDFRLAIRYYLGVNDNELTVIPYIKNLGEDDIPYDLGFAWELKDIQIDMTTSGDYIKIDGSSFYLNQTLDETYTSLESACYYISEDITDTLSKSLYLRWDKDLVYKVTVKSRDGQYNAPVTLYIKVGTLDSGQEKYTSIFWYDADQMVYYFDDYGEAWNNNPGYMVDGIENTYASTTMFTDVELCDNNTCNGSYLGIISKVELRCKGYRSGINVDLILRPFYNGVTEGDDCTFDVPTGSGNWSEWFDITNSEGSMEAWSWSDVEELDCEVQPSFGLGMYTLFCSMVELRITYNTNYAPEVSDPYPADESTGISIAPVLNITVYDADSDLMNISWSSNSSGSWLEFATNNNVGNDVYNQTFSNASENGQWWYWRVNVSDGANYTISDVYSFFTGFESKIQNTGNLNMSGHLFIRVDFYNTSSEGWELETNVIDEKFTTRIINVSKTLALDTIFNPANVNTSSFSHGNGTYRIYAALCDPWNNVLRVCDNSQYPPIWWYLMDSYEFTVTGL